MKLEFQKTEAATQRTDLCFLNFDSTDRQTQRDMKRQTERDRQRDTYRKTDRETKGDGQTERVKQKKRDRREGKKEMNPEMDPYSIFRHRRRGPVLLQSGYQNITVDEKIVGRSGSVSRSVIGCFGVTASAQRLKTLVLINHLLIATEPQDLKTTAAAADQKQSVA